MASSPSKKAIQTAYFPFLGQSQPASSNMTGFLRWRRVIASRRGNGSGGAHERWLARSARSFIATGFATGKASWNDANDDGHSQNYFSSRSHLLSLRGRQTPFAPPHHHPGHSDTDEIQTYEDSHENQHGRRVGRRGKDGSENGDNQNGVAKILHEQFWSKDSKEG